MSGGPGDGGASALRVQEVLELLQNSPDPDLELLQRTIAAAGARNPDLPCVIRLAAIPRRFNARVVGVLRGREDDDEGNHELMGLLSEFSFTRRREDGGYALDYEVRKRLLDEWHSNDQRRETFREHNRRLADFYRTRVGEMRGYAADLAVAAPVLLQVSRARYAALSEQVEALEVEPLLEALYHETLCSLREGFAFFESAFMRYQSELRTAVCASLLRSMRDNLRRLPPGELGNIELWLEYWEARLANERHQYGRATEILLPLRERAGDDPMLLLWTLSELANALSGQDRLVEAGGAVDEELALAEATRVNPYNIPTSHLRVADHLFRCGELHAAILACRRAIAAAHVHNNAKIGVQARVRLAATLAEGGKRSEALAAAVEAIDLLRASATVVPAAEQAVLEQLMWLVRDDHALLDTLRHEAAAILPAGSDPLTPLAVGLTYVEQLSDGGQFARAEAALRVIAKDASGHSEDWFLSRLLLIQGKLRWAQGRLDEAIEAYGLVLGLTPAGHEVGWDGAAALSNRGEIYRIQGRWDEALDDLRLARQHFKRIGHTRLDAVVTVLEAGVHEHRHRAAALEQRIPPPDTPAARAEAYRLRGEVLGCHARWDEADAEYQRGLEAGGGGASAARIWLARAAVAARRGAWGDAIERVLQARHACATLPDAGANAEAEPADEAPELDRAEALLREAAPHLTDEVPLRFASRMSLEGWVLRDRGRPAEAREPILRARESYLLASEPAAAADMVVDLADLAAARGHWSEVRAHLAELTGLWGSRARADAYRPGEADTAADRENARGIRAMDGAETKRPGKLSLARKLFRAAGKLRPAAFWFPLNRAYAAMQLADWADAAQALEEVLERAPHGFFASALNERLSALHLRRGHALADTGDTVAALPVFRRARTLLDGAFAGDEAVAPSSLDAWLDAGDGFLKVGRPDDAEACYTAGLARLGPEPPPATAARIACRWALLDSQRERLAPAVEHLKEAVRLVGTEPDGASAFTDELARFATTPETYRTATEPLRALAAVLTPDAPARCTVLNVQLRLARACYADTLSTARGASAAQPAPLLVTPLIVEAATGLFPPGDAWTEEHPLFKRHLPLLRERVEAETGVVLPGVRVRATEDLEPDRFRVLLKETVVFSGQVLPGGRFVPVSSSEASAEVTAEHDPRPGFPDGVWILGETGTHDGDPDLPAWDPLEYVVHCLEAAIRPRLGEFMGLQELASRLEKWFEAAADPEVREARRQRVARSLPDLAVRARFVAMLRALLREAVPVVDLGVLLVAFEATGGENAREAAEEARLALRERIPAAHSSHTFVRLGAEVEAAFADSVSSPGGTRVVSLERRWLGELLLAVGELLSDQDPLRTSVVVEAAELRPFVRAALAPRFPELGVVAARELGSAAELTRAAVVSLNEATLAAP